MNFPDAQTLIKTLPNGNRALIRGVPLGYASDPGGALDSIVDFRPTRIDNVLFNGWQVTAAGYHYRLGNDGWIGYGGRRGGRWIGYRPVRVGWLKQSTKQVEFVGGAPNYDTNNLTSRQITRNFGGEDYHLGHQVKWNNIWTGGDLVIRASGGALKSEIHISNAAKNGLLSALDAVDVTGRTSNDWHLVAFYQLDINAALLKLIRNGVEQPLDASLDTDDNGTESLEWRDELDRFIGFMPVSRGWVITAENDLIGQRSLRKRLFVHNGTPYLAVGLPASAVNAAPAGTIVIDPSVNPSIAAGGDDYRVSGSGIFVTNSDHQIGKSTASSNVREAGGMMFKSITFDSGAVFSNAYVEVIWRTTQSSKDVDWILTANKAASPSIPGSAAAHDSAARTTANTTGNIINSTNGDAYQMDATAIVQELSDSYTYTSGDILFFWDDNATPSTPSFNRHQWESYESNSAEVAVFFAEWVVGTPRQLRQSVTLPHMSTYRAGRF